MQQRGVVSPCVAMLAKGLNRSHQDVLIAAPIRNGEHLPEAHGMAKVELLEGKLKTHRGIEDSLTRIWKSISLNRIAPSVLDAVLCGATGVAQAQRAGGKSVWRKPYGCNFR